MTLILDGKIVAQKLREQVSSDVDAQTKKGIIPTLAIVTANIDPSSLSYVNTLIKTAEKVGIKTILEQPGPNQTKLEETVKALADNPKINAIMLQTPLPKKIDKAKLAVLIPVEKDVDGANPTSTGLLDQGLECFAPATAQAVMEILKYYEIELNGKNAVVIGRSNIVGKPLVQLLLAENATVTICHSKTQDLSQFTKSADIIIPAIGKAKIIKPEHVSKNAVVVDVGINFVDGNICGDVDFDKVSPLVKAISPVPGGVGPVTAVVLLKHVCQSTKNNL